MKNYLLASIGLNLFLAGMILAPHLSGQDALRPPMPPRGGVPFFGAVADSLPQDQAAKLHAIFDDEHKGFEGRHERMRANMKRAAEILKMDQPDMAALHEVFAEVEKEGQSMHTGMSRMIERVAQELSPESRRKLAEAMENAPEGRGPRGSEPPPPPMDR